MAQTLEQKRAAYAWECSRLAKERRMAQYPDLAKSVPTLIMNAGLMQTLAFLQGKGKDHHLQLLGDLIRWLGKPEQLGGQRVSADRDVSRTFPVEKLSTYAGVMPALHQADADFYRRASAETIALLRWIRHLAGTV